MKDETRKYKTLEQLQEAYANGTIDKRNKLVLDNDNCTLYVGMDCLYWGGGPSELIEEALDLLKIPWENA